MVGGKGLGGGILGFICGIRALNKQKKRDLIGFKDAKFILYSRKVSTLALKQICYHPPLNTCQCLAI